MTHSEVFFLASTCTCFYRQEHVSQTYLPLDICNCLKNDVQELRDVPVVKSMSCSHRVLKFSSQHPRQATLHCLWLQLLKELTPSSGFHGHLHAHAYYHTKKKHVHIIKNKHSKILLMFKVSCLFFCVRSLFLFMVWFSDEPGKQGESLWIEVDSESNFFSFLAISSKSHSGK